MAKKLLAIAFGFALAPAFISAQDTAGGSIVGTVCLVRVYSSNFAFPPEGGRIVQVGSEMYFWRNYLPECANILPSNQQVVVTSYSGTPTNVGNLQGNFPPSVVGNDCAVRVYHTNFEFPPQGGKIVQVGSEMYFIKDYIPGCESAGAGGTVLVASTSNYNPAQSSINVSAGNSLTYVNPSLSSTVNNSSPVTTTPTSSTCR